MEEAKSRNQRLLHLDLLRVLAAFAVVVCHVSGQAFSESGYEHESWYASVIYTSVVRWCIPVFVMISGALFLDSKKTASIKTIFCKYVRNVAIAFCVWSVLYTILLIHKLETFEDIIVNIIHGPYHFWFLKMLIGLYIAVPILKLIAERKRLEVYFIRLSIITASVIPVLFYFYEPGHSPIARAIYNWVDTADLDIALGYSGYFMLGHYLTTVTVSKKRTGLLYILGLIGTAGVMLMTIWEVKATGTSNEYWMQPLNPFPLMMGIAVFLFVVRNKERIDKRYHKLIAHAAKMSLGVYIIHVIVIWRLNTFLHLSATSFNTIFSIPLLSVLTFCISYIIAWVLNGIPYVRVLVDWSKTGFSKR